MLRHHFAITILSLGMLGLTACSSGKQQVQAELKGAVGDNHKAKTLQEWQASDNNPERLFPKWKVMVAKGDLTSADVCASLKEVKDSELTVFGEQISSDEYESVVKDCRDELQTRLEKYFARERKDLKNNLENKANSWGFQFPDNIQVRDTSHGYPTSAGDVEKNEVVLTFDDGPVPGKTGVVLEVLDKVNAKAIFFQLGKNVRANPALVQKVAQAGHSIGAHSMTHRCFGADPSCQKQNGGRMLSDAEVRQEIFGSFNAILRVIGWADPFFRFPFGDATKARKALLARNGLAEFQWNVDSLDWKTSSPKVIVKTVMNQVRANSRNGKGSIVLLHDVQKQTTEALPEILSQLYNSGYKIVLLKPKDVLRGSMNPKP